jgi:hypothetical protein
MEISIAERPGGSEANLEISREREIGRSRFSFLQAGTHCA